MLQKRVIRIIAGVNRRTHCQPYFASLGILSLSDVFKYNVSLFMYKYFHRKLPSIFDIFQLNNEIHQHNTRQSQHLHQPKPKTEFGKRFFRYQRVLIWNNSYANLNVNVKIGLFKKTLKEHLLKSQLSKAYQFHFYLSMTSILFHGKYLIQIKQIIFGTFD